MRVLVAVMPVIGKMFCYIMVLIALDSGMLLLLSHWLANTIVPWDQVRILVSNHLIALDKCPGVRPVRKIEYSMLMMLLHVVSYLIFMSGLIYSSIMDLCMFIIQIHLAKCYVVVDFYCHDCAVNIFSPIGVKVVSHRFLGSSFRRYFCKR